MSAFRVRRRRRPPLFQPVDLDDLADGLPCPYCAAITAPDDLGIWRCLCGWSGMVLSPVTPEDSEGHAGIA